MDKHSSLLGALVSYEEIKVLRKRPLAISCYHEAFSKCQFLSKISFRIPLKQILLVFLLKSSLSL
jgi:hypothetical protein